VRLAEELGFASTAHFSDAFLDRFGIRPSELDSAAAGRAPAPQPGPPQAPDPQTAQTRAREAYGRYTG
jgi:AraC-like DNA-binding protein